MPRPAVGVVVQARLSSVRLPGKVLRPVAGRPMLAYQIESLRQSTVDSIIVATSDEPSDDDLARWCAANDVAVFRGSLRHVAARMLAAAAGLEAVVRISGDSPLLDHRLVDLAVELWLTHRPDLVTNVSPRTFPRGQSVEVVSVETLAVAIPEMRDERHLEHVTTWFYDHADAYRILPIRHEPDLSSMDLSVDDEAGLARVAALLAAMDRPHWTYPLDDLVGLATLHPPGGTPRKVELDT